MKIKEFETILDDSFLLDLYYPDSIFFKKDFNSATRIEWTIRELKVFVKEHLESNEAPLDDYIKLVSEFIRKMEEFSRCNKFKRSVFTKACDTAADVKEILLAMK